MNPMEPKMPRVEGGVEFRNLVPTADKVIAVASGKGGVGKSSLAVNLAIALQQQGHVVGLLDADIYGPSLPRMLGTAEAELTLTGEKLNPIERFHLKTLSIGNLVPADQAAIWRGPMIHQALQHLMSGTNWGELDYLIVDLPPGTGDVHLTMMQSVKVDGAVLVSTPQQVALADVRKCVDMFQKVKIPIIGIIENMAFFECAHGEKYYLFGKNGAKAFGEELGIPLLGEIPLIPTMMQKGEEGIPFALDDEQKIFEKIATNMKGRMHGQDQNRRTGT